MLRHRAALLAGLLLSACGEGATADPAAPDAALADAAADAAVPLTGYDGPRRPVEIHLDEHGIPHIYAADDLDLFFGNGYQQAADRLYALEIARRAALGTLAELQGEARLSSDLQARVIGFPRLAAASLARLAAEAPADHNLLVAFAAGVNRRIDEVRAGQADLPDGLEAAPAAFTAEHLLAMGLRIQFGFSETIDYDLLNTLLPRVAPGGAALPVHQPGAAAFYLAGGAASAPATAAPAAAEKAALDPEEVKALLRGLRRFQRDLEVGEGSNAWAVAGEHTATGRPLLANDSHARLRDPAAMYLVHLNSADAGGSFDVMGYAFLGVPGVHVGHNRHVAWGATTAFADVSDLWDVRVDGDAVVLGDRRLPVEVITETIRVRQPDGTFAERTIDAQAVPGVGIVLPDELLPVPRALLARGALLLGWPGFALDGIADFQVFTGFDRARSLDDFRAAVDRQETGIQNWHFISAEGIALRTGGLVPDRGPTADRPRAGSLLDGADPRTAWTGEHLSRARLPFIDGGRPFIASANNDPWGHTANGDPYDDAFYYGAFFAPGYRAATLDARLAELTARGGITREEMQALQLDLRSAAADRLIPLLAAVDLSGADAGVAAARDRLVAWDRRMAQASEDAALFRVWLAYLSRRVLADDLGLLFEAIDEAQPVYTVKFTTLAIEHDIQELLDAPVDEVLAAALADAAAELAARGPVTWGDLHRAAFLAPDRSEALIATDGGDTTLNVAQCRFWKDGALQPHCVSEAGAVYRHVTLIAEDGQPETWANAPGMNGGGSTADWAEGRYLRWPFRRAEVEAATRRTITLEPR